MKTLLLVCDGLGDRPVRELGGKTPLEYARHPTLDFLANRGDAYILHPVRPGVPSASDIAHLHIFGYDTAVEYPGRGVFEALGAGASLPKGSLAFRLNLATVERDGKLLRVVDRRAGRIPTWLAAELIESLNRELEEVAGFRCRFYSTVEHRGVLVIAGGDLSPHITSCDPHEEGKPLLKVKPARRKVRYPFDPATAGKTAEVVNEIVMKAHSVLSKHPINRKRKKEGKPPANAILLRGAGIASQLESFTRRWGVKAACIAGGAMYKGIAKALGFEVLEVKGATGRVDTNLRAKFSAAIKALSTHDFVFLHVKATDSLSHDRKPVEKAMFIERIDSELAHVIEDLGEVVLCVTGDHTTSSMLGKHTGDPVPMVVWYSGARGAGCRFDERSILSRGLEVYGLDLMSILLNAAGMLEELDYDVRDESEPLELSSP